MENTDLHIRVKSKFGTTQQVILYQQAVTLDAQNFKTAAWEHQYIAPGAQMRALLPAEISVGAMEKIGHDGKIMTNLIPAECNTAWDIYNNNNALDVRKSSEPYPPTNPPTPKNGAASFLTQLQITTNNSNQLQVQVTPNNSNS